MILLPDRFRCARCGRPLTPASTRILLQLRSSLCSSRSGDRSSMRPITLALRFASNSSSNLPMPFIERSVSELIILSVVMLLNCGEFSSSMSFTAVTRQSKEWYSCFALAI